MKLKTFKFLALGLLFSLSAISQAQTFENADGAYVPLSTYLTERTAKLDTMIWYHAMDVHSGLASILNRTKSEFLVVDPKKSELGPIYYKDEMCADMPMGRLKRGLYELKDCSIEEPYYVSVGSDACPMGYCVYKFKVYAGPLEQQFYVKLENDPD